MIWLPDTFESCGGVRAMIKPVGSEYGREKSQPRFYHWVYAQVTRSSNARWGMGGVQNDIGALAARRKEGHVFRPPFSLLFLKLGL